jgi:hypothetical protein
MSRSLASAERAERASSHRRQRHAQFPSSHCTQTESCACSFHTIFAAPRPTAVAVRNRPAKSHGHGLAWTMRTFESQPSMTRTGYRRRRDHASATCRNPRAIARSGAIPHPSRAVRRAAAAPTLFDGACVPAREIHAENRLIEARRVAHTGAPFRRATRCSSHRFAACASLSR